MSRNNKRAVRKSTKESKPGRYQEDYEQGFGPERAAFAMPDPVFDPELARHCAFPSLDPTTPGLGPSEEYKLRRDAEQKKKAAGGEIIVV